MTGLTRIALIGRHVFCAVRELNPAYDLLTLQWHWNLNSNYGPGQKVLMLKCIHKHTVHWYWQYIKNQRSTQCTEAGIDRLIAIYSKTPILSSCVHFPQFYAYFAVPAKCPQKHCFLNLTLPWISCHFYMGPKKLKIGVLLHVARYPLQYVLQE